MITQLQKEKVLKLISNRSGRTVEELKDGILREGIEDVASREVSNITKVLKEQKIKDANSYEPTDDEIDAVLDGEK